MAKKRERERKKKRQYNGEIAVFPQMVLEQLDIHTPRERGRENPDMDLTPFTNMNSNGSQA